MPLLCVQRKHEARSREETDHSDRDGDSGGLGHAHYAAIIRVRFAGVEPYEARITLNVLGHAQSEALGGIARMSFQMNAASLPDPTLMKAIEAIGTRVAPLVRDIREGTLMSPPLESLVARVRGEYLEMPGLRVTFARACRLWQLDAATCEMLLDHLVGEGFLNRTASGFYVAAATSHRRI